MFNKRLVFAVLRPIATLIVVSSVMNAVSLACAQVVALQTASVRQMWIEYLVGSNWHPALFATSDNVRLGGDDFVVVTGAEEDGLADAVITRKGQQPIRTILHADFPLEASDRIVDILELDYDPITGLSLYGAYVEY